MVQTSPLPFKGLDSAGPLALSPAFLPPHLYFPSISQKKPRTSHLPHPNLPKSNRQSIGDSRAMALKRKEGDPVPSNKKGKRVGFAAVDPGVEANECMKVFLVSRPDEVNAKSIVPIDPVDLNQFFGEDGKIYGYKDLKINVWLSCVSFHAYADITSKGTSDGGRGITDLKSSLQKIFGESLVEKEEFFRTFASDINYIRNAILNGTVVRSDRRGCASGNAVGAQMDAGSSSFEVVRMDISTMDAGLLYSRLVPLVLLLVEGGSPIDITDPRWEIYFVVEKNLNESGDPLYVLLGFSTLYRFYHYPDSLRLRIGQILVLPPYQGNGHGRRLLETINSIATSENAYDVTSEEPSDYLQYLRACVDTSRLLAFEPIKPALNEVVSYLKEGHLAKKKRKFQLYPPLDAIETARENLKINKKQFLRCWDVLVYLKLDGGNPKCKEDFRACISDGLKYDYLDKSAGSNGKHLVELPNEFGQDMTFAIFRSDDEGQQACLESNGNVDSNREAQEQQLNQVVNERMEEIVEVARKVRQFGVTGHVKK